MREKYSVTYAEFVIGLDEKSICTWNMKHRGSCRGDSGNGLIHEGKLIGIVSSSFGCALGYPDIHTNVFPFLKWMESIVKISPGDTPLKVVHPKIKN